MANSSLTVGTAEFGNGTSTVHRQIAATALATTVDQISLRQSDTAHGGHDTGAYGSAGTFVAGRATQAAAEALAVQIKAFAASRFGENPDACSLDNGATLCVGRRASYAQLAASAQSLGKVPQRQRHLGRHAAFGGLQCAGLSRRREQAHRRDQDTQKRATPPDAGRVVNPMQCRGPGRRRRRPIARGNAVRGNGDRRTTAVVVNPKFRDYHLPSFAGHSAHRGVLRRYLRHDRANGRQIDERKPLQSGGRRARQCAGRMPPASVSRRCRSSRTGYSRCCTRNSAPSLSAKRPA